MCLIFNSYLSSPAISATVNVNKHFMGEQKNMDFSVFIIHWEFL